MREFTRRRVSSGLLASIGLVISGKIGGRAFAKDGWGVGVVVGNGAYATAPLPNAKRDAKRIAQLLSGLGLRVIYALDLTPSELPTLIEKARSSYRKGPMIFYYAGHGAARNHTQYIKLIRQDEYNEYISIYELIKKLNISKTQNIYIFDCCRTETTRNIDDKLEPFPNDELIATSAGVVFSTQKYAPASDGMGVNSDFSLATEKYLPSRIVSVTESILNIRAYMSVLTDGQQVPGMYGYFDTGRSIYGNIVISDEAGLSTLNAAPSDANVVESADKRSPRMGEEHDASQQVDELTEVISHTDREGGSEAEDGRGSITPPRSLEEARTIIKNKTTNRYNEAFIIIYENTGRSVRAVTLLGYCYEYGIGTKIDKSLATNAYEHGIRGGDVLAYNNLACLIYKVSGMTKKVNSLLTTAIEKKFTPAMANLGVMLIQSKNQEHIKRAIEYFKIGSDHGDLYCSYNLGIYYKKTNRRRKYIALMKKLALSGFGPAEYAYGKLILDGDVAGTDDDGIAFVRLASKRGVDIATKYLHSRGWR